MFNQINKIKAKSKTKMFANIISAVFVQTLLLLLEELTFKSYPLTHSVHCIPDPWQSLQY